MKCYVCGKEITSKSVSLWKGEAVCCKHYTQLVKYGHALDNCQYTINDSNEYEIDGKTSYIILRNRKGTIVSKAIIDTDMLEKLIVHKWRFWKGRVYTGHKKIITMAHMVMGVNAIEKNMVVDHINRNPLDNRKCNLRIAKKSDNNINKSMQSNNTSNYAGVHFDSTRRCWCALIEKNNIKTYLGRYKNIYDAVYARYIAEILLFKEFRSDCNNKNINNMIKFCDKKQDLKTYVTERLSHRLDFVGTAFEH